jgi:hypothetical protein
LSGALPGSWRRSERWRDDPSTYRDCSSGRVNTTPRDACAVRVSPGPVLNPCRNIKVPDAARRVHAEVPCGDPITASRCKRLHGSTVGRVRLRRAESRVTATPSAVPILLSFRHLARWRGRSRAGTVGHERVVAHRIHLGRGWTLDEGVAQYADANT